MKTFPFTISVPGGCSILVNAHSAAVKPDGSLALYDESGHMLMALASGRWEEVKDSDLHVEVTFERDCRNCGGLFDLTPLGKRVAGAAKEKRNGKT